jgi:hypothetical protein
LGQEFLKPFMNLKPHRIFLFATLILTSGVKAQDINDVTQLLKQLQSAYIQTRKSAMFELQTSLDPRIPDACLPVLKMEGDSIRRLAARAIGSRWHQIPKERVPHFTASLTTQLKSDHAGLVNMARRGIALLNRSYSDPMVSHSRNKRWVIYERYGLPCLIETRNMTEELLGYPSEAKMACAWGNEELAPTVIWHPRKDMVAMDMIVHRKLSTIWIWAHRKGLRQLSMDEMLESLGHKQDDVVGYAGLFAQSEGWNGDSLDFSLSYTEMDGENFIEHEAKLRWNPGTDRVSALSDKVLQ